ncbi:MAG TPA: M14 family zinc carboxypeptidase, partial [Candidatus Acidoferrales bacterium]
MRTIKLHHFVYVMLFAAIMSAATVSAQTAPKLTTPKEQFGFSVADDFQMVSYTQAEAFWKKLATESDRMKLVDIGNTAEGRHQWMVIISSPDNLKNLAHYKEISQKLARAEGVSEAEARNLSKEGKAIIWIDGGLHANETVGFQQLVETIYQLLSRTDDETMRFLHDEIILCVPANPDGSEMVANWYN